MKKDPAAYRRRVMARFDAHLWDCRRARLKLEAAARTAQLELVADENIERAAIQGAA